MKKFRESRIKKNRKLKKILQKKKDLTKKSMDQKEKWKKHVARRAYLLCSKVIRGFTALADDVMVEAEEDLILGCVVRWIDSISL